MKKLLLSALALSLASKCALATTEDSPLHPSYRLSDPFIEQSAHGSRLDPSDAYFRTQAVLKYFGVPAETDTQSFFDDLQGELGLNTIQARLPYMDFHSQFDLFSEFSDGELRVFRDRQSKRVLDYRVKLSPSPSSEVIDSPYRQHLLRAVRNPVGRPLSGLRIALDPGHMGGDLWDERTGKFVRDQKGRKLSEGVLALQISLLLEKSLIDLGAEVRVTRYGLTPVTPLPYESYDLRERALMALRKDSLDDWFQSRLAVSTPGPKLYKGFARSPQVQKLFSESQRWEYFVLGYDLDARVASINEFKPDITLIIHLDAGNVGSDPNGVNTKPRDGTKVYVPGAFFSSEFTSREDRKFFGRQLLDMTAWNDSVKLARTIVRYFHDEMNLPFDRPNPENSIEIEPGVQTRSLRVQRQLTSQVTAYVECLFYNDPNEFEALLVTKYPMTIDGRDVPYSDRLAQIAATLNSAVVSFVKTYAEPPAAR